MQLIRLDLAGVRSIQQASLAPGPGLNLLLGANGAGKTSVLEALHLMAHGRSFRGRVRDGLVRRGADALEVFAHWQEASDRQRRAGLRHTGQAWQGRLDGAAVGQLGDLYAALSVVSFEPGSHALVTGTAEIRRRYLDWGLFHVEPGFLPQWRRYARALKQRNTLLRTGAAGRLLEPWEQEMHAAGTALTRHRADYLVRLQSGVRDVAAELLPAAGGTTLRFQPGWRQDELSLVDALLLARERDQAAGFSSVGPHRADWRIEHAALPGREALSRGQAKLTALSALLAQAADLAAQCGEWPVVALDDLASELDRAHQTRVLHWLLACGAQVLVTGTERPPGMDQVAADACVFHVELTPGEGTRVRPGSGPGIPGATVSAAAASPGGSTP